jgi:hypothetical protein
MLQSLRYVLILRLISLGMPKDDRQIKTKLSVDRAN